MRMTSLATTLLVAALSVGAEPSANQDAAERAALEWLALVDSGQFAQSWEEAASLFKSQVSTSQWEAAASRARSPLGAVKSRSLLNATYAKSLPGAPDGEYVVLQFQAEFANKSHAIETVTPTLDDGAWRVSGYFVR